MTGPRKEKVDVVRHRPRPRRVAVVLLLASTFCASALVASGALRTSTDLSRSSTRILTPEEAAQQAEQGPPQGREAAPVALVALLLLAGGALLISLAVPARGELRRPAAEPVAAPAPPPRLAPPAAPARPQLEETTILPAATQRRVGAQIPQSAGPPRPSGGGQVAPGFTAKLTSYPQVTA